MATVYTRPPHHQSSYLSGQAETDDADELRMAVFDAICGKDTAKRNVYKDAMVAIRAQFDLNQYAYKKLMHPRTQTPTQLLPAHTATNVLGRRD